MMSEGREPAVPAATFTLLSNEIRVAVVRALADASRPLRFSELRSRVGVRDGGRFNYHLQKLCGRLVEKTDEGYVLTDAGDRAAALLTDREREGGLSTDRERDGEL